MKNINVYNTTLLVLVLVGCGKNKIKPPKELALNEDV